jgi:DNA topoisomerase I
LIVERERQRIEFQTAAYSSLEAEMSSGATFTAALTAINDVRVATGRDFDSQGELSQADKTIVNIDQGKELASTLTGAEFTVQSVDSKPYRRRPAAPFMTSTLQQEASGRLGFSASRTMGAAQKLYEEGHITYMRTDSTTLSADALSAARTLIRDRYGLEHLPADARVYNKKVKNAQEAHEAIRPAGDAWRNPADLGFKGDKADSDQARLYQLIWSRTIASQMNDAEGQTVTIRLAASPSGSETYEFGTSGTVITSPGFRAVYGQQSEESDDEERALPNLLEGDAVVASSLESKDHQTKPPARYTEATLVRRLEELGVGRPSTYASILGTIQSRGYVWKKGQALVPALTAFATVGLMENHFPHLVDYALTASMEDDLDQISVGEIEPNPWLSDFYFGGVNANGEPLQGLRNLVSDEHLADIDPVEINTIPIGVDNDGQVVVAKVGKNFPYVQRGEEYRSLPAGITPDEITLDLAIELLETPEEQVLGVDPATGIEVIARPGTFGPYVSLGRPPKMPAASSPGGQLLALPLHKKELKVALAYMRCMTDEPDNDSVRLAIKNPKRGIGDAAIKRLIEFSEAHETSLLEAFERTEEAGSSAAAQKAVRSFLKLRKKILDLRESDAPAALQSCLEQSGYIKDLNRGDNEDRLTNINSLVETSRLFESIVEVVAELDRIAELKNQPKPKTASLFQTMTLERITLEEALELLSLPRIVGTDPADGVAITVQNGPYGPYLLKDGESRNLQNEEQLLTITLEECLQLLSVPKKFGRRAAKPPLKELGKDPNSDQPILLKDGKFGPYVTDGTTNASLKSWDSVEALTEQRAIELLAEKRP